MATVTVDATPVVPTTGALAANTALSGLLGPLLRVSTKPHYLHWDKRLDQPDRKKYLSYHVSAVEAYLRVIGKSETLRVGPFMTAVLAHGDIPYCGLEKIIEIGIAEHVGRDAGTAWKRVLGGQFLAPSASSVQIEQSPSPVRVYGQGY